MKVLAIGAVVLFLGFWMVQDPGSMARFTGDAASWTWDMTSMLFSAVIDFTSRLFS